MYVKALIGLSMVCSSPSWAGEVALACAKAKLPVLELSRKERAENLQRIKTFAAGKPSLSFYSKFFGHSEKDESKLESFVSEANGALFRKEKVPKAFLKYASEKSRKSDPKGYSEEVRKLIHELNPGSRIKWFSNLKDPRLREVSFAPAQKNETGEVYGAVSRVERLSNSKVYDLKIIFSNHASESLPYLIPLIEHELVHAQSYEKIIELYDQLNQLAEFLIVDEARAFEEQMTTYLDLARRYPMLFCDWMYVSWSLGNIPVPLSWFMASLEKWLVSGVFIYQYAREGAYRGYDHLLNPGKSDLREDLKERIQKLNLRFVKVMDEQKSSAD